MKNRKFANLIEFQLFSWRLQSSINNSFTGYWYLLRLPPGIFCVHSSASACQTETHPHFLFREKGEKFRLKLQQSLSFCICI